MSTKKNRSDRPRISASRARSDLQASGQQKGQPGILVIALVGTMLFMFFYYHILVLNQMTQITEGIAMLDQRPLGFSQADVVALAEVMDDDALGQLNWVHKTAGVMFSLSFGAAMFGVVMWATKAKAVRWTTGLLSLAFIVVDLIGNVTIESALINPDVAATASALVIARWWIMFILIALAVTLLVLKFVAKVRTSVNEVTARR